MKTTGATMQERIADQASSMSSHGRPVVYWRCERRSASFIRLMITRVETGSSAIYDLHHDDMDSSRFRCGMMPHQLMPISAPRGDRDGCYDSRRGEGCEHSADSRRSPIFAQEPAQPITTFDHHRFRSGLFFFRRSAIRRFEI